MTVVQRIGKVASDTIGLALTAVAVFTETLKLLVEHIDSFVDSLHEKSQ